VVDITPVSLSDYVYPPWADGIGWLLFVVSVSMIPLFAVIEAVKTYLEDTSLLPLVTNDTSSDLLSNDGI